MLTTPSEKPNSQPAGLVLYCLPPRAPNPRGKVMSNFVTFHFDSARSGWNPQASVSLDAGWGLYADIDLTPDPNRWTKQGIFPPTPGAVRGQPLYLHWTFTAGPHNGRTENIILVATNSNNVYALSETDIRARVTQASRTVRLDGNNKPYIWHTPLGVPLNNLNINIPPPQGVASSMVVDLQSRRLFVLSLQ